MPPAPNLPAEGAERQQEREATDHKGGSIDDGVVSGSVVPVTPAQSSSAGQSARCGRLKGLTGTSGGADEQPLISSPGDRTSLTRVAREPSEGGGTFNHERPRQEV